MCTLQNFDFFPCCAVVRHVRVGQKISDMSDVELPHVEGLSRNVTKLSLRSWMSRIVTPAYHSISAAQSRLWDNKNALSTVQIFVASLLAVIIHH